MDPSCLGQPILKNRASRFEAREGCAALSWFGLVLILVLVPVLTLALALTMTLILSLILILRPRGSARARLTWRKVGQADAFEFSGGRELAGRGLASA